VSKKPKGGEGGLPSKSDILRFLEESDDKITKRELARAFRIKGSDRVALKDRLREMLEEGSIERAPDKSLLPAGKLPSVTVVEVAGPDAYGDMLVRPLNWKGTTPPPRIYLDDTRRRGKAAQLGQGDRALVRLTRNPDEATYSASVIKALEGAPKQILGVFHGGDLGGRVTPVRKGARSELLIEEGQHGGAVDGELVLAELLPRRHGRMRGLKPARVIDRHGDVSAPGQISLIAIHEQELPTRFSKEAEHEAAAARPVPLGEREDLRDIPLITIDPADARDHDDAVFAEPDPDPNNPGGWHLIVAIADVAHYVRAGSALDKEARTRGNSAYFPDRVVPMLPEGLSNEMCSLKPGEDRACMAVHVWIDREGRKLRHEFVRALMRSAANIAYPEVQAAVDGTPSPETEPLLERVLRPLYGAHEALDRARQVREPLEIQSEEKKIILDEAGRVVDIRPREELRAHRVIEEFMILANVCAAETLEAQRVACMYRVHEEPALDKLEELREFLASLDFKLPRAQVITPALFNRALHRFKNTPQDSLINQVVLRSQTQAYYSPENRGHFGLALPRYAHFTSPIRRYADVLVHRGLIRALSLGKDGLTHAEAEAMAATGEHISMTERRAMAAERDSVDRYLAAFLAGQVGGSFKGRISGVTRFGLFVTLEPSGGDGLVPVSSMASDYYAYEPGRHALVGRRHGRVYQLGDEVEVRLLEAQPVSGGLRLELIGEPTLPEGGAARPTDVHPRRRHKGKPPARKGKAKGKARKAAKSGAAKANRRR